MPPFPPLGDDSEEAADKIIAYQTAATDKNDIFKLSRFIENEQFRFLCGSKPWMGTPRNANRTTEPFFEPITTQPGMRLASQNEIIPIIEGETSRLIGSTSEPAVQASKKTTRFRRAAKDSDLVLKNILDENNWVDINHADARNTVQYGTSWILSGWRNNYQKMMSGPAEVHACGCGWKVRSDSGEDTPNGLRFTGSMATGMIQNGIGHSISQPTDPGAYSTISECPECGSGLEKRRANPALDGETDAFGEDLIEEKPLPEVFVELYPDTDVFPVGGGRCKHGFLSEVSIESLVTLDWLMQRYEHASDVKGKSLGELGDLTRWHPSGLEMWGARGTSMTVDDKRWAVYRITIRQPFENLDDPKKSEPMGRLMISANKTVLFNGPLLFEYQPTDKDGNPEGEKVRVPRMSLFPFQNEVQNDSCIGISTTARLVDPQLAINSQLTQLLWDMATNGSPTLLVPRAANLEGQGDGFEVDESTNLPNQIIRFDPDAGAPTALEGKVTHASWKEILDSRIEAMQRMTAQSQLDRGQAVSGAPSASAQMFIGQRLDETRKPKGQRYAERMGNLFSYMLRCVCAVYTDKRQFYAVDRNDVRTMRELSAVDLLGQVQVKVSVKPAYDTEAFQRQNTLELLQANLIEVNTPSQRLRVARKLGSVEELDPEPNQQITTAQNEFIDFQFGNPPVDPIVKVRTDNHRLHIETGYEELRSQDGESITRMWSPHELATTGWYDSFKTLMDEEMRLTVAPIPPPTSQIDPVTQEHNVPAELAAADTYANELKTKAMIESLPKNIEERIYKMQTTMVQKWEGFAALEPDDQSDLMRLTRYLSHLEAHQWEEDKQAAKSAPTPVAGQQPQGAKVAA
jgi:hypothetical protein